MTSAGKADGSDELRHASLRRLLSRLLPGRESLALTEWRTCLLDPPWNERGSGKIKRGAQKHYPLLKTPQILDVVLKSPLWGPPSDGHMYMWATSNFLVDALWLISSLGFTYKTNVVWVKTRPGIGQYFRGQHELMLFATRGRGFAVKTDRRDLPSAIRADHVLDEHGRRVHSAKPAAFYEMIESRSFGPYAEFFARRPMDGWSSWGNEL
jgi:N6-adenosine-specific RNA methylase IME4